MNKQYVLLVLLLVLIAGGALIFTRGNNQSETNNAGKIPVAASFYPLYFFATQIGGDKVAVTNITPSGAEPHDYDPTTGDIAKIEGSKLLILNGSVEAWGDRIKETLAGTPVKVVVAGQGLLTKQLTENGQTMADPHVWLDPALAKQEAHAVEQGLESVDAAHASYYQTNEQALDAKLDTLDGEFKAGLVMCKQKNIITSHAAFAYLGERYGLTQVPIAGLSPDQEPSPADLAKVAAFAKANKVKYIFFESLVSPKLSQTIASEVGAQTMVLDPIEGISDDNQNAGQDYFTVMRSNLANLKVALECAP